jgi:L-glyceraldehyde 3-phosphate reductase
MAAQRGQSLAQMALNWILKDDMVTSVLVGASRPEQILDNIKIVDRAPFDEEELKKIDEICAQM